MLHADMIRPIVDIVIHYCRRKPYVAEMIDQLQARERKLLEAASGNIWWPVEAKPPAGEYLGTVINEVGEPNPRVMIVRFTETRHWCMIAGLRVIAWKEKPAPYEPPENRY